MSTMKTAKAWVHGLVTDSHKCLCRQCAVTRQIQLEAFKAGMTEAAEICEQQFYARGSVLTTKQAILSARDRKDLSL